MKLTLNGTPEEIRSFLSLGVEVIRAPGPVGPVVATPSRTVPPPVISAPSTSTVAPPVQQESAGEVSAEEAFSFFQAKLLEWLRGFEKPDEPQPDRVDIIRTMGSGRMMVPILRLAFQRGSLQKLIADALIPYRSDPYDREAWLDYIQRVSAQMVAISHSGFPDLDGALDYSTKWRRDYVEL